MDIITATSILSSGVTTFLWTMITSQMVSTVQAEYYVLNDTARNALSAQTVCIDMGYHGLAQVDTEQALAEVLDLIDSENYEYWIGMHYSKERNAHVWDTGFTVTWAAWTPGEPDNLPSDTCVRIRHTQLFGTFDCAAEFLAVCSTYDKYGQQMTLKWPNTAPSDSSSIIWDGYTRSLLDCSARCIRDTRCLYIAFNRLGSLCSLLSNEFDVDNGSQAIIGTMLGIKVLDFGTS